MATDYLSHNITIIGGDYRHFLLYNDFVQKGFSVSGIALHDDLHPDTRLNTKSVCAIDTLLPSDVWITGIPFTKDHTHVYSENKNYYITIDYFFHHLKKHPPKLLIGGHFPKEVLDFARNYQIPCHDLLKCDTIALKNAIPTAEGAIYHAIEASPHVIHRNKCLVLGFGKCGKLLAQKLKGLDAQVTVCARKEDDLATAESFGYDTISFEQLNSSLGNYLFLFNTVPAKVLDKQRLSFVSKDAVIIDIASIPGGTDFEVAEKLGIPARHCLGIPGKLCPKTAADILATQIITLLKAI